MNKYTKRLMKKGIERQRLTDQLKHIVDQSAAVIAETMPEGSMVHIPGVGTYKPVVMQTHLGTFRFLGVQEEPTVWAVFTDSDAPKIASRESYLAFANNINTIMQAFEDVNDGIIQALANAFAELRKAAKIQ